jgi:hypothetical protein
MQNLIKLEKTSAQIGTIISKQEQFSQEMFDFYCEVKWSYGEVLGDKKAMYIRVPLYGGYVIVL